jgi:hypothetical protein
MVKKVKAVKDDSKVKEAKKQEEATVNKVEDLDESLTVKQKKENA